MSIGHTILSLFPRFKLKKENIEHKIVATGFLSFPQLLLLFLLRMNKAYVWEKKRKCVKEMAENTLQSRLIDLSYVNFWIDESSKKERKKPAIFINFFVHK
jgi:hypothetical protein